MVKLILFNLLIKKVKRLRKIPVFDNSFKQKFGLSYQNTQHICAGSHTI